MIGRFVQQQHARILRKELGKKRPLQLSAESVSNSDRQNASFPSVRAPARPRARRPARPRKKARRIGVTPQAHNGTDRKAIAHRMRLRQHADKLRQFVCAVSAHILAEYAHLARIWHALRHRVDDGAFPRPLGPTIMSQSPPSSEK